LMKVGSMISTFKLAQMSVWVLLSRVCLPYCNEPCLTSNICFSALGIRYSIRSQKLTRLQYLQESENSSRTFEPFLLLGLLVNYNKFEYRNPYRLRFEDFVNETTIQKIVTGLGNVLGQSRSKYSAVLDDVPKEGWTLSSTLTYIGLGVLAPIKAITPTVTADDSTERFAALWARTYILWILRFANSKPDLRLKLLFF